MAGFDWDEANVRHIARHGVMPDEVEQVFSRLYVESQGDVYEGEERTIIQGTTTTGRFLTVAYALRGVKIRCVTAYPMSRKDRKLYAPYILEK